MSSRERFAMVPEEMALVSGLGDHSWRVYIAIRVHGGGEAFPSQRTLSRMTELDRRDVRRAVDKLVEAGLIEVERQRRPNGGNSSNFYRIVQGTLGAQERPPLGAQERPPLGAQERPPLGAQERPPLGAQERQARKRPREQTILKYPIEGCPTQLDGRPAGRSAPLHSTSEREVPPQREGQPPIRDASAYAAEISARKRQNWLGDLNTYVGEQLPREERPQYWTAINDAQAAGSRAATPSASTDLLDELDRRRRSQNQPPSGSARAVLRSSR
jgi:helix-turn-helix protein